MIPLSRHTAVILDDTGAPLPVDPVSITVSLDDEWSPYIQGRIVVHASDAAALDRARVLVRLRQAFGPDLPVAALTDWAGGSIAEVTRLAGGAARAITAALVIPWNRFEQLRNLKLFTARWGGSVAAVTADCAGTVATVTELMRQPGGSYDPPPAQTLDCLVRVRPAEANPATGLVEYEIEGEDIALHDYRRTAATTWESPHIRLRALVIYLLDHVGGILDPSDDPLILSGATWAPGQTIWDALHPVLEAVGYRLTAGLDGRYRLDPDGAAPSGVILDADTNLVDWQTSTEPPYDGAIIEYTGATPSTYGVYAPPGAQRILHETRATVKPGNAAAELLALRAAARGRSARATCTALYGLRPRTTTEVHPLGPPVSAVVSAVTWTYPDARMAVTLRNLTTP